MQTKFCSDKFMLLNWVLFFNMGMLILQKTYYYHFYCSDCLNKNVWTISNFLMNHKTKLSLVVLIKIVSKIKKKIMYLLYNMTFLFGYSRIWRFLTNKQLKCVKLCTILLWKLSKFCFVFSQYKLYSIINQF